MATETITPAPTYDAYGRMNYHPEYHPNNGKPWTTTDVKYLIEYYEKIGPEQVGLDIGRTIHAVMTRAYELRKKGLMPKGTCKKHRRIERIEIANNTQI